MVLRREGTSLDTKPTVMSTGGSGRRNQRKGLREHHNWQSRKPELFSLIKRPALRQRFHQRFRALKRQRCRAGILRGGFNFANDIIRKRSILASVPHRQRQLHRRGFQLLIFPFAALDKRLNAKRGRVCDHDRYLALLLMRAS